MSKERFFSTISSYDKSSNGVVSLPIRPNQGSQYGSPGLSGKELQARFDKLASVIIAKYNTMAEALSSDVALEYLRLPAGINLTTEEPNTLNTLLKSLVDAQGYLMSIDPETDKAKRLNDVLDSLYSMISDEASTRAEADTKLGKKIDGETSDRIEADTVLRNSIDEERTERKKDIASEKSQRESADSDLFKRINNEAAARESADTQLSASISSEAAARKSGDDILNTKYNNIDKRVANLDTKVGVIRDDVDGLSTNFLNLKSTVDYFFSTISDGSNDPIDRLSEIVYFLEENRDIIEVLRNDKIDKTSIVTTEDAFEVATDKQVPSAKFIREHFKDLGKDLDFVTDEELNKVLEDYLKAAVAEQDYVKKTYLKDALDDYVTDDTLKETLLNYATKENLLKYASKEDIAQSLKYIITSYSSTTEGIDAWIGKNEYWNVASISGISVGDNIVFRCDNTTTGKHSYVFASVTEVEANMNNNRIRAVSEGVLHSGSANGGVDEEINPLLEDIYYTDGTVGLVYEVYDDIAVLVDTGAFTDEEEIEIATMVKGVPVTKIESRSFHCKNAHTVIIHPSIRLIDVSAFKGADSLQNILYDGSIAGWNEISKYATGNEALTNATVHSFGMVTPNAVFAEGAKCDKTTLEIPAYFKGIPVRIVGHPHTEKFILPETVTSVTIPDTVTDIMGKAFTYEQLRSITLSKNLVAIRPNTFSGSGLLEIVLPRGLQSIDRDAFRQCSYLQTAFIPKSVVDIGEYAFGLCTSLTSIRYEGTRDEWNAIQKDVNWMYGSNPTILFEQGG